MDLILAGLVVTLFFILVLPLFKLYGKNKFIHKCIDVLPGDKWYPLVGSSYSLLRTPVEDRWDAMSQKHSIFGPIYRSWYGPKPSVHIYKPEHIQKLLKSQTQIYKGKNYQAFTSWLGQGLMLGGGDYWRRHRKIIRPAFYAAILDSYMDIFIKHAENVVDVLDKHVGDDCVDIFPYLNQCALDIIAETAMGVKIDFLKNPSSEYPQAITNYALLAVKRMFHPIGQNEFLYGLTEDAKHMKMNLDIIQKFNKKIIAERKLLYQQNKADEFHDFDSKKNLTFLDLLLSYQESDNFTDEEIAEEVNTFMFGGQDTTSLTVTYTLLAIGNHPHVQKRLQEEIDSIYNGQERPVTSDDFSKMEYMERVIKETLRAYNFVPYISRSLVEDIEIEGRVIPKDVSVVVSLYDLHRDPDIYPEPEKFDPDRFLPEISAKRHPYAYIPFSAGPRNCIGQNFGMKNAKTVITYILRRYNVTCLEKPEDIKKSYEIVLKPQSGLKVRLERRH